MSKWRPRSGRRHQADILSALLLVVAAVGSFLLGRWSAGG
jgi:hypothetical protein